MTQNEKFNIENLIKKQPPLQISCPHCPNKFNNKSTLTNHLIKHSDDAPYKCIFCSVAIKRKADFLKHCLIHNRVGVDCPVCLIKFDGVKECAEHILLLHRESTDIDLTHVELLKLVK